MSSEQAVVHDTPGTQERPDLSGWQAHPWVGEGGSRRTRLGIGVTGRAASAPWETRLRLVLALEELGFDSFWQADHPVASRDCWLTLAALATHTHRIRLGSMVSCVYYRPATLLARHAADVDFMSAGRAVLGLGAGWVEDEFRLLGIPFPPAADRTTLLRETVEVVRGLWTTETVVGSQPVDGHENLGALVWARAPFTYRGKQLRFERTGFAHPPVQTPRVPLLIGGSGEQVTFRLVARYADMANIEEGHAKTPEALRAKLDVLRRRCDEVRRPFETLLPSYFLNGVVVGKNEARVQEKLSRLRFGSPNVGTPDEMVARLRRIVDSGVRYLVLNLASYDDLDTAELLTEHVVPRLQDAPVA